MERRVSAVLALFGWFLRDSSSDRLRPSFDDQEHCMLWLQLNHITNPDVSQIDTIQHISELSHEFYAHR